MRFDKMWRFLRQPLQWSLSRVSVQIDTNSKLKPFWSRIIIFCDFTKCEDFHDICKTTMVSKPFWIRIIIYCNFYKMWRFPWQNHNGAKAFLKPYYNILSFYKMWRFWSPRFSWQNHYGAKGFLKSYHNILEFYKMWRFPWQNHNGAKGFLKSYSVILWF